MIKVTKDLDGRMHYTGTYGLHVLCDLYDCNPETFNRESIEAFLTKLCVKIDMDREDFHFWDDVGVSEEKKQTEPQTKGTSVGGVFQKRVGIQFIITSTVVIHCLDILKRVYVDVFSCKDFHEEAVLYLAWNWFQAKSGRSHRVERD